MKRHFALILAILLIAAALARAYDRLLEEL